MSLFIYFFKINYLILEDTSNSGQSMILWFCVKIAHKRCNIQTQITGHTAAEPNVVGVSEGTSSGSRRLQCWSPTFPLFTLFCWTSEPAALASQHVSNILRGLMFAGKMCYLRSWGIHMDHLLPHSISANGLNFLSVAEEGDYLSAVSWGRS